ncbi:hypothetical protein [Sphingobium yanoikuyae]|uniref:hypothetical protein n=1 Tax=Sphingobium yanoikuyae TaxID=13690 RepID=UPI0035C74536
MGLMPAQTNGQPQGQMQPGQDQRDPSRYTDDSDNGVSPEEQAQYSQFEQNYMRLIYTDGGEVNPEVLKALQSGSGAQVDTQGEGTPPHIMALASTAVTIVTKLDDSAREANKPLSDDVLTQGGVAVIEELAEVAEAAGIHDYSEDELSGATAVAFDMYRDKAISDGRTDENTLKSQFDQVLSGEDRSLEAMAGGGQQQPQEEAEPNGGR